MAETFRHGSAHSQTLVTGAARFAEGQASRAERQARLRASQERAAREQSRAQLSATARVVAANTAAGDVAERAAERSERALDAAALTDTTSRAAYPTAVSPDVTAGSAAAPESGRAEELEAAPGPEL